MSTPAVSLEDVRHAEPNGPTSILRPCRTNAACRAPGGPSRQSSPSSPACGLGRRAEIHLGRPDRRELAPLPSSRRHLGHSPTGNAHPQAIFIDDRGDHRLAASQFVKGHSEGTSESLQRTPCALSLELFVTTESAEVRTEQRETYGPAVDVARSRDMEIARVRLSSSLRPGLCPHTQRAIPL